jgi:hypothetical protein
MPSSIWQHFPARHMVVQVKLKNGRIVRGIYVDRKGNIEGRIVGGQDGLTEDVGFSDDDLVAVRAEGIFTSILRLGKWTVRS